MDTKQSIVQNDDVKDDSKGSMPPQFIVNTPICKRDGSKYDAIVQNDDNGDDDINDLQVGQGDSDVNSENAEPMLQLGLGGGSESYPERRRLKRPRHQGQGDSDVDSENAEPMLQLGLGGGSELYPERRRSKRPRHQAPFFEEYYCEMQDVTPSDRGLRNDLFRMSTFDPRRRDSIVPNDDGSQVEQGDSGGGGSIARQIIGDSNRASSEASVSTPRSHEQVIAGKNVQINALMQTDSGGISVAGQNHRKRWSKLKAWILLTKKKQPRGTKKQ